MPVGPLNYCFNCNTTYRSYEYNELFLKALWDTARCISIGNLSNISGHLHMTLRDTISEHICAICTSEPDIWTSTNGTSGRSEIVSHLHMTLRDTITGRLCVLRTFR
jgi:hypothetical protein